LIVSERLEQCLDPAVGSEAVRELAKYVDRETMEIVLALVRAQSSSFCLYEPNEPFSFYEPYEPFVTVRAATDFFSTHGDAVGLSGCRQERVLSAVLGRKGPEGRLLFYVV
jgi:hypothetical protein